MKLTAEQRQTFDDALVAYYRRLYPGRPVRIVRNPIDAVSDPHPTPRNDDDRFEDAA